MKIQIELERKIKSCLKPDFFNIENESRKHAAQLGEESHFKILVVSDAFEGKSRVQRQRDFHEMVKGEMAQGIHALSLRLLTPEEFNRAESEFESPDCHSKTLLKK